MKFTKFIIHSYKAIDNDLSLELDKENVLALIGLNECGKTTILKAITAFDKRCDAYQSEYLQFEDLEKKYSLESTKEDQASISAFFEIKDQTEKESLKNKIIESNWFRYDEKNQEIFAKIIENENNENCENAKDTATTFDEEKYKETLNEFLNGEIEVRRNIGKDKKTYSIVWDKFYKTTENDQNLFVEFMLQYCPEILFFSDNIKYDDRVSITDTTITKKINDNLFMKVGGKDLKQFFDLNEDAQGSYISDVNKLINDKFMKEWNNLSINQRFGTLELELKHNSLDKSITIKIFEKLKQKDGSELKRQFSLKDRSSGFNWYFCFVLTLLFYPSGEQQINKSKIYLFDEPGLYLHENAQRNLAKTFEQLSETNIVIYTTHCHGMLNIDLTNSENSFSLKNIFIVSKEPGEFIKLYPSFNYVDIEKKSEVNTASFKPIVHALQISFSALLKDRQPVIIVEGINDFYVLHAILRTELGDIAIFPSMGADNVIKHIPYFLMNKNPFVVLFDNDSKGLECSEKIKEIFGEFIYKQTLFLNQGNYAETRQDSDKFVMDDYFIANKPKYLEMLKTRSSQSWYSKFAEKIYKKDYTNQIKEIDPDLISKFQDLLVKIKQKLKNFNRS